MSTRSSNPSSSLDGPSVRRNPKGSANVNARTKVACSSSMTAPTQKRASREVNIGRTGYHLNRQGGVSENSIVCSCDSTNDSRTAHLGRGYLGSQNPQIAVLADPLQREMVFCTWALGLRDGTVV